MTIHSRVRKPVKLTFAAFVLAAAPWVASALVFGGSNLGFGGYPDHECYKPSKPFKPYSFDSQWEIDSYNAEVDAYNSELQIYIDCIRDYIENGYNDIERIEQKIEDAIEEAERDF